MKEKELSFDDEGGMIAGAGTGFGKKAAGIGGAAVGAYVHEIFQELDVSSYLQDQEDDFHEA